MDKARKNMMSWMSLLVGVVLLTTTLPQSAAAQDQDDPPGRVARLGYMQGSVSFQPAGEPDWVQAVPNRPMTTGDKLWADRDSRAEVELGSAVIRLAANTGFSFLNLDDQTVQIQVTSGSINVTVRRLDRDDVFEVDTPNLAFSVFQPGRYRVEASEDGDYTVVSVREGEGESTGNGQTYTLHAGQRATFSGTETLNAEVVEIGRPDAFENWAYSRDRRHQGSRSAQYLSHDVVGYEDLDDYGEWRDDRSYGHVWFPTQVAAGWAPYREGHWVWISPWGWTWVDDEPWGYAPFHYGRWVVIGNRWGWVAGPVDVVPVYAPALVVFLGAGGGGFGGNVGWFPLGPREVYVPSYTVSRAYINRVNVSNTTVNTTTITSVYNTTIVNRTANITNVSYVNRNVAGAVTAVPQHAFVSAQPVARAAVAVNVREMASVPVSSRAAVAPSRESVLGPRASSAGRVAAPPADVSSRPVVAKATPPPPPVPFARQQQALAAHPGQPLERHEVRNLRPANTPAAQPMVKLAPPGKPATPNRGPGGPPARKGGRPGQPASEAPGDRPASAGRPGQPANEAPADRPANAGRRGQPANEAPADRPANAERPGQPANEAPADRPANAGRPGQPANGAPADRPANAGRPGQPANEAPADRPASAGRPGQPANEAPADRPANAGRRGQPANEAPADRPANAGRRGQPADAPAVDQPANRPGNRPAPNERPGVTNPAQPDNRPESKRPTEPPARNDRPSSARPDNRPEPNRNEPAPRSQTQTPPPSERQQPRTPPPAAAGPGSQQQQGTKAKPQTPEEKKRQDEKRKREEKPPPPQ